jgi:phage protein D
MDKKTDADTVQDDKKISFYKVDTKQQAVFYLCREKFEQGKESQSRLIKEARFSLSTVRQYKRVEVRGWDPKKKKNIVGFAEESDYDFGGTPGWKATGKALYGSDADGKVFTVVDHPVESKEEADAIAKAIFNQLSLDFITGEVDIEGEPEVVPGNIIELCQFGERFSGKYLITGLTHIVSPSGEGYRTRINFVSNNIMKV